MTVPTLLTAVLKMASGLRSPTVQCDARDAGHVMTPLHRDKWRHTLSPVDTRQHINNVASGGEGEGHTINIDMMKLIYFYDFALNLTLLTTT